MDEYYCQSEKKRYSDSEDEVVIQSSNYDKIGRNMSQITGFRGWEAINWRGKQQIPTNKNHHVGLCRC